MSREYNSNILTPSSMPDFLGVLCELDISFNVGSTHIRLLGI